MHYVDPAAGTDDPSHGGAGGACAFKTITYALTKATGAISLAPAVYQEPAETFPLTLTSQQLLCKAGATAATIRGSGRNNPYATIIISGTVASTLSDCIVDGTQNFSIGGCVNVTGPARINNSTIMNCGHYGVRSQAPDLVVQGSTIQMAGIGVDLWPDSTNKLNGNTFDGNQSDIECMATSTPVTGSGNKTSLGGPPACYTCIGCPFQ